MLKFYPVYFIRLTTSHDSTIVTKFAIEEVGQPAGWLQSLHQTRKGTTMLLAIAAILVVLWVLGLLTSYTMGGFIHVLLVIAIVVVLYNVFAKRKAL